MRANFLQAVEFHAQFTFCKLKLMIAKLHSGIVLARFAPVACQGAAPAVKLGAATNSRTRYYNSNPAVVFLLPAGTDSHC